MGVLGIFAFIGYMIVIIAMILLVAFMLFSTLDYLREGNRVMCAVGIIGTSLSTWVLTYMIVAPFVGMG